MNYSKRLIHQVVPLHFAPTFFLLESRSQSHGDHSAIRQPSPAIPEVQVNTLICEGIIFLSEKHWQNLLFGCGSFRVFLLVFFPRDEAPLVKLF